MNETTSYDVSRSISSTQLSSSSSSSSTAYTLNEQSSLLRFRNGKNGPKSASSAASRYVQKAPMACAILPGNFVNFDAIPKKPTLTPDYPPPCLELVNSDEWIRRYGLKTNKLSYENVLSMIGFKQSNDYINQVKQIIGSRYAKGMFLQIHTKDGFTYNITSTEDKLIDLMRRLDENIRLYRLRLQWLTSDSRRLFGVITEQSVCLVIDCKNRDQDQFVQYKNCILRLLKEQISKISSFNIIRCAQKIECFSDKSVVVSPQSIEDAIDWLNSWVREFENCTTDTTTVEATALAFKDKTIEAIYLISEGVSSNGTREILYDRLVKLSHENQIALNVISFNCSDLDTVEFLRRVAENSFGPGKFHAYCLLKYYEDYTHGPVDPDPTKNKVVMNKRVFGGVPSGAGIKKDLMMIFDEIEFARECQECIKTVLETMHRNKSQQQYGHSESVVLSQKSQSVSRLDEEYLTSKQWLAKNGLGAKGLDLFDVLKQVCFRHCDGVVDLKKEPVTGKVYIINDEKVYYQGDSIPSPKLVNAKYCDQFAHVLWNDGTVMHVSVTPDMQRNYEQKMNIALEQFEKRIDWLSKGSRELFGTVIEKNICILLDTSQSMQLSLDFVKRKSINLLHEQLRSKQRFNLVAFNSKIYPWRDRMIEVDEASLKSASDWINSLNAQGTTNTLAAIRFALSDLNTEAIYLLSDGRPDQEPRQILAQIHLNTRIPIHTISFNCNDTEGNKFLSQLARETNGRYHYFNENGWEADPDGPSPYQSEDVSLLKKEIEQGKLFLSQIVNLREECARLAMLDKSGPKRLLSRSSVSRSDNFSVTKYQTKQVSDLSKSTNGVLSSLHDIQSLEWVLPETRALLERQLRNQFSKSIKKVDVKSSSTYVQQTTKKSKEVKQISNDSSLLKSHSRIAKWIEKNNLASLKLTIFDVLLALSGKKKTPPPAENVLIVDDLYEAKVWNEILDLADVSGIDKNRFKFVNPSTINLTQFENKLEAQIKIYRKYLAEQIWKSLPDIEKIILDNQQPLQFDDTNREFLLKSLQYCNWPISKQDIELVEKEINLAQTYIRLCKELNYYILHKTELDKETVSLVEDQIQLDKEPIEPDLRSEKSDVEIEKLMMIASKKEDSNFLRGDAVIARHDQLGYYFTGKITKIIDSRHANVKFENGVKQEKMSMRNIVKAGRNHQLIALGDYVMANVVNEFDQKCWVPGIVQTIDQISFPKFYTILYFNGQEGDNTRPELIRINRNMYGFIVNYIRDRLGLKTNIKPNHEDQKIEPPRPRSPSPIDMNEIKKGIIDEIKSHVDSLKIGEKYELMHEELVSMKNKQKTYKKDLDGKFKVLRNDFEEWKKQEPPVILPNPNLFLYQDNQQEQQKVVSGNKRRSPKVVADDIVVIKSPPSPKVELTVEEKLLKLRRELPKLEVGEEVLAKWPDDGWYYRSIVKDYLGNCKYVVEDSLRDTEQIYREDLISDAHDAFDNFEEGDPVVALHPEYEFSYAPGQINKISSDGTKFFVKFYDYREEVVPRNEVYKLPRIKFNVDVNNIINLEKRWKGELVVARNDQSYVYEIGTIEHIGSNRQYQIRWSKNNETAKQSANHIFGKYTRRQDILINDYVLAPRKDDYLPGRVVGRQGDQLRVKFFDGLVDENVSCSQSYWLSKDYYEDVCKFCRQKVDSEQETTARSNHSSSSSISIRSVSYGKTTFTNKPNNIIYSDDE